MGTVVDLKGRVLLESVHFQCECGSISFKLGGVSIDGGGWMLKWVECTDCGYQHNFRDE